MPEPTDLERDLRALDAGLRQLEAEYTMYFAGRRARPPVEMRRRIETLVRRLDRLHIPNTAERFRFTTLQSRYASFAELWDRGLRSREEGRPVGPFAPREPPKTASPRAAAARARSTDGEVVTGFKDPSREPDKLKALYDRLTEARRAVGEEPVPFDRFTDLVKEQVQQLRDQGNPEVAFRVSVKDGKVAFTAKGIRGETS